MSEVSLADLKSFPTSYQSSRPLHDVLVGDDTASVLIEASSSGNVIELKNLLSKPHWTKIALEKPHRIYDEINPRQQEGASRAVSAMPILNLQWAISSAAENGQATAVSTLLTFASEQGIELSSIIDRRTINKAIINGHAAVIEALASADPTTVVNFSLGHGKLPLDLAVARLRTEVVAVLLQHGADPESPHSKKAGSYRSSLLSLAARARGPYMTESLLNHGVPVAKSGALHLAAELGALDTMRLLIQHGVDVNELLPGESLPMLNQSLLASWTPMHFAAAKGQADAVKLLEDNGARSDVKDENGKTPAQLLEESK